MTGIFFDGALIEAHASPGAPVLLALSGGADSCAALSLLDAHCRANGRPLAAAHLDHAIRPTSAEDARFCLALCAGMGIPCFTRRTDVPALARATGRGLEEAARDARYRFFAEIMAEQGIGVLVTAHHADDNLETLLLHLTRGSGLRGLCGIPPVRAFAGGLLLRPLLRTAKADLLAYCEAHQLRFCTDETNTDTAYTRNRIRAEVAPVLAAINPTVSRRMADTADALRADEAYLAEAADALRQSLPDGRSADAAWLRGQPAAMRWRLYAGMHAVLSPDAGLEMVHLRALDRLLDGSGGALSLPGRVTAVFGCGRLTFTSVDTSPPSPPEGWQMPAYPGRQTLGALAAETAILPDAELGENVVESDTNIYKLFINRHLNFDKIKGYPYWRTRKAGDVLLLRGRHRKVKKLLQEGRIPPSDRDRLPLLCDDEGIVCLPGIGIRDGLREGNMTLTVQLTERKDIT